MPQQQKLQPIDDAFPDFFFVPGQHNGRYPNANSLLVLTNENPQEALLMDAGIGRHTLQKILHNMQITKVWLSHWHEDHVYGCPLLRKSGATIACHPNDIPVLQDVSLFNMLYKVTDTSLQKMFDEVLQSLGIENIPVVESLHTGKMYNVGNDHIIQVIHTPGHTKGHCCFYFPEARLIFLADIDLSGLGPWYGALDSSVDDFERSIQSVLALNAEYVITSHKGLYKGKVEIKKELQLYLDIIYNRDQRILVALGERKPKTSQDLVGKQIVYKNYNGEFKDYLPIAEGIMINLHLTRLLQKGKIAKEGTGYILQ
ncbi:MAG: hypothetical protein RBG13Loki_0817 [Promethearchaeota archaeon CR_4]|nr:MAG: hypothetical protein RBG13Loki_0817 [Candidatus Lokiarchaeota archaeon CR_4]